VHGLKKKLERNGLVLECVRVHAYLGEEDNVENYMRCCLYIVLGCKTMHKLNFIEETIDGIKTLMLLRRCFFPQRSIIIFLFEDDSKLKLVQIQHSRYVCVYHFLAFGLTLVR
jgi:hypothetical protein